MKKVLMVIFEVQYGGAENIAELMSSALEEMGYCIDIITNSKKLVSKLDKLNGKIYLCKNEIRDVYKIFKSISFKSYGCVIAHKWDGIYIMRKICVKNQIPLIAVVHSLYYEGLEKDRKLNVNIIKVINEDCDIVIAISESQAKNLFLAGVKESKIILLINVSKKIEKIEYQKYNSKILYVGRLSHEKGVDLLLDAIKLRENLKKVKVDIVGDGPERQYLEELAFQRYHLKNVVFQGYQENIVDFYKTAKFVVVPSRREAFSLVALEAKMMGVPIVGFNTGGLKENILDRITGELVEKENVNCLGATIEKMYMNSELCALYSQNAKKVWKNSNDLYAWKNLLNKIVGMYY